MGPKVTIRPAISDDAPAILQCLHIAFEPYRSFYSEQGFSDTVLTKETIHRRLADFQVLVAATSSGEIVGTIAYSVQQAGKGHLRGMAVLPDRMGTGLAQSLLDASETELRKLGCDRITLDTTAPLQRAIRFYERNGYRRSNKVGDHFGMPLYEFVKTLPMGEVDYSGTI